MKDAHEELLKDTVKKLENDTIKELKVLYRWYNNYHKYKECYAGLGEALQKNESVTSVALDFYEISDEYVVNAVKNITTKNKSLCSLYLNNIPCEDQIFGQLVKILKNSKGLTSLHLIFTGSGDDTNNFLLFMKELQNNKNLTELSLVRLKVMDDNSFSMLLNLLTKDERLKMLDLSSCSLGSKRAEEIVKILKVNKALVSLNLYGNQLKESGEFFVDLLNDNNNTTLTSLNLNANELDNGIVIKLLDCMKKNTTIQSLYLGQNDTNDNILPVLVEMIETNKTLTELSLKRMGLSEEGLIKMFHALKKNNTLTLLDLSDSNITNEVVNELCEWLTMNEMLKSLCLVNGSFSVPGFMNIINSLKENRTLSSLTFSGFVLNEKSTQVILDMLKINPVITDICFVGTYVGIMPFINEINDRLEINRKLRQVYKETALTFLLIAKSQQKNTQQQATMPKFPPKYILKMIIEDFRQTNTLIPEKLHNENNSVIFSKNSLFKTTNSKSNKKEKDSEPKSKYKNKK